MGQLFLLNNIILVICIIIMLVLGFIIYLNSKKAISIKVFFFCILIAIIWIFTNLMANFALTQFQDYLLFWTRMSLVGPAFLPILLIVFANSFPENEITLKKVYQLILSSITLIILFLIPTKYNVESVAIIDPLRLESTFTPGPLYIFFAVYLIFGILMAAYIMVRKYPKLQKLERLQIKNVLIGLASSVLAGLLLSAILPIFGYNQLINMGPMAAIFFIVFTAYAIVKHQLFNIRVIATETLVALIVLVLLIQTLLSKTLIEGLIKGLFLVLVAYFGYLLIKSVIQEIERRKQIEKLTKQLEQANYYLQEMDKMKSEFVSIASHDLLTPVAAIEGYLSMILEDKIVPIKNDKLKEYLQRVYGSSKRLARLIADLLNISRIEEGRLSIDRKEHNIVDIVENVIKELSLQADKHHLYLRFNKPKEKISKVYVDAGHIKEVIINLVGNAIKFTKTGVVTIELEILSKEEIEKRVAKLEKNMHYQAKKSNEMLPWFTESKSKEIIGDQQVVIHIKDTGIGISDQEMPSLFQKFYRGAGWTVGNIQGAGLGLYISKSLVELDHGRIWIEKAELGKGSDFAFSIPFSQYADSVKKDNKARAEEVRIKPLAQGPKREF